MLHSSSSKFKALPHHNGDLTAFPQRYKYLQIAQVTAVQSPATLLKRCEDAVQSPRTPRGGVYFEHAQRQDRVSSTGPSARTLLKRSLNGREREPHFDIARDRAHLSFIQLTKN